MSAAAAGAAAGAAAAAEARRRMEEEEQELTRYDGADLDAWEFKIVRANTPRFRNPMFLATTLEEEAQAGWSLVEKFDDYRIRLKRRRGSTASPTSAIDPYRSHVGMEPGAMVGIIVGITFGSLALMLLIIFLAA